jgi:uncharacterized damage-inducible protein DinB
MQSVEKLFLSASARTLRDGYLPKIKEAVELLTDEEIWSRSGESNNSVGNLILHLSGNIRQYILSGAGGKPDQRNRPLEFKANGGISRDLLLKELEKTVLEAYHVLATMDPHQLSEEGTIQSKKQMLCEAIYHSVEHFAYHAGQIIYIVKARRQHGFGWYKHLDAPTATDFPELRPLGSITD